MKRSTILSITVLSIIIWQPASAATFQPVIEIKPSIQVETIDTTPILTPEITVTPEIKEVPIIVETPKLEVIAPEVISPEEKETPQIQVIESPALDSVKVTEKSPLIEAVEEKKEVELKEKPPITEPEQIVLEPAQIPEALEQAVTPSNVIMEVTEEGDSLKYKLKVAPNHPIYKSDASGDEEILQMSPKKEIQFHVRDRLFLVEDKETYDYNDLMGQDDDFSMGFDLKQSADGNNPRMTAIPKNDCLEVSFYEDLRRPISICEDFDLREDGLYLPGEKTEDDILLPHLDNFYESIHADHQKQNADVVGLTVVTGEDQKPRYEVDVVERHKLFWLIPVKIHATVSIDVESNQFEEVDYGFGGLFFAEKNYDLPIKILPNLVISKVEITPKTWHTGLPIKFKITTKNTGLRGSYAGFTDPEGPSRISLYLGGDLQIDNKETGFFLSPGETETRILDWSALLCDVPLVIKADPDNRIEEISETDNSWNYTIKCQPNDAPDLTVTSVSHSDGSKRIGVLNEVNFTIANQGSQPSAEFTSFYSWNGLSKSVAVPALQPGESVVRTHKYTPTDCEAVKLELDTSDVIIENNEDNNIAYEPDEGCKSRPDLAISDNVWWQAVDYSLNSTASNGIIYGGEPLWFKTTIKNLSASPEGNSACVQSPQVAIQINGQTVQTLPLQYMGCISNPNFQTPNTWERAIDFKYTPQCNGERLSIVVDAANAISESKENNNSWNFDIICQPAPPVATSN